MDILDSEASEDEAARKDTRINRQPSHEANKDLIEQERRYRSILDQATVSDELVRQKWDEWENNVVELTWDEVRLSSSELESSNSSPESLKSSVRKPLRLRYLRRLYQPRVPRLTAPKPKRTPAHCAFSSSRSMIYSVLAPILSKGLNVWLTQMTFSLES